MKSKSYIVDRALHWISALLLLFMLMNLSTQLHHVDWDIKGQVLHRQDAVELHAFIGIILVIIMFGRLIFPYLTRTKIERVQPESKKHSVFIKVTHISLYSCIFLLAATGVALINNYQIPLTVFGFELAPDKDVFYQVFPKIHETHMFLKQLIWWLIAVHFIGIMYAKR
ncbi:MULTISPECIES: cytochrome b/b6 domain-containing protein [unclassified Arsukibacterium]|uniref:cytochrome b/b6 domain-containing protein n=1 Tax=unclassified Arsukibacterium TaxID=2635278 RepID=UPI000C4F073D|nr:MULTISPECIES: cytochrome b/b6 domain-containing protein [unclassified Arsukibacterium]MBM35196.1 hypothetical protein [Rheinheimera sp.]HAW94089.1 hypothetical protein [Candidatus Azambacteria bacterium]|tara:strand:- start:30 stop:536 length:507 start_codon:yes stop_codon:yes gene_type:complete